MESNSDDADGQRPEAETARRLFAAELRRLRGVRGLSQRELAGRIVHSRALVAEVERGERWPPEDLAIRCDEVLGTDGALTRLWPLVAAERRAAREIVDGARLTDLRRAVLELAAMTGTDLSVLGVMEAEQVND
jgi:transcriptional regulator with XRE-family HTH domain